MATGYGNGFVTNGLVHLVDASNIKSYPGASTTWYDISGNNRNGTLNNGLIWGAGNEGAISFDGSNDYVSFTNDIYSTLTTTTFSVWFYLNGSSTWQRVYDFGRVQTLNIFFTPTSGGGVPRFVINIGGGEQSLNDTTSVTTGVWYNFVVTLNGSQAQMYRNGDLVATNTSFTYTPASLGSTTQTWFGRSQYPDPYLSGKIAQFAAYNRVLNSTEIKQNFNYLKNKFQSTSVFSPTQISGLQLWLDADDPRTLYSDTSGTTKATTDGTAVALWVDKSGNGRNASQSTSGYRPLLKTNIINGRNVLRGDGNDRFDCGDVIEPATTITIFAVAKSSSTGQYCILGKGGSGNYYNAYTLFFNVSGTNTHVSFNTSTVGTGLSISSSNNIFYLVSGMYNGSNIFQWQNGNPATTALTGNLVYNSDNLRIGMMPDSGNSFGLVGDIAEVLIYNSLLTASQRIQVETYLNNKWGLWASFNPSSISGLTLWLDASDPASLFQDTGGVIPAFNDGDPIALWKDKSGNARDASQTGSTQRPLLKKNIQNSKNILRFDGSNDYFGLPAGNYGDSLTCFIVYKWTAASTPGNAGYIYAFAGSVSPKQKLNVMYMNSSQPTYYFGERTNTAYLGNTSKGAYFVNTTTFTSPYGAANLATYDNGISLSISSFGSIGSGGATNDNVIGADKITSGIQVFTGDMAEIIVYNSVLTLAQRQQVEQYLNQKWGVF